jgi:hypothetical protein
MLSALQFMATPARSAQRCAGHHNEMYRKQLRKVPPSRHGFILAGENWCSRLQASTASTTSFALNELKRFAWFRGDIWVKDPPLQKF